MNTHTYSIPYTSLSATTELPVYFYDRTILDVNIQNLPEVPLIQNIHVNWGDGISETYANRFYKFYRTDSIFAELTGGKITSIYAETMNHIYDIQSDSVFSRLSCNVVIDYVNGYCQTFTQPIVYKINEFHDAIKELKLQNIQVLPKEANPIKSVYITETGYVIENTSP